MKIVEYTTVNGSGPLELENNVIKYMKMGYQPFGSVYIWNKWLTQTMVKYELKEIKF